MPWIKSLEFAYGRALLSKDERSKFYFEFIADDLVRADIAQRMSAYRTAIDGGFLTPNEARAAENRPALPGGDELRAASSAIQETVVTGHDENGRIKSFERQIVQRGHANDNTQIVQDQAA
jgi:hypothetical protein